MQMEPTLRFRSQSLLLFWAEILVISKVFLSTVKSDPRMTSVAQFKCPSNSNPEDVLCSSLFQGPNTSSFTPFSSANLQTFDKIHNGQGEMLASSSTPDFLAVLLRDFPPPPVPPEFTRCEGDVELTCETGSVTSKSKAKLSSGVQTVIAIGSIFVLLIATILLSVVFKKKFRRRMTVAPKCCCDHGTGTPVRERGRESPYVTEIAFNATPTPPEVDIPETKKNRTNEQNETNNNDKVCDDYNSTWAYTSSFEPSQK